MVTIELQKIIGPLLEVKPTSHCGCMTTRNGQNGCEAEKSKSQ